MEEERVREEALLTDEEIDKALRPYWIDSEICPHCKAIRQGGYVLSPEERDRAVAQAQVNNTLKIVEENK